MLLRRIPRDPFAEDPSLSNVQTWNTRAYSSSAEAPQPGADVFDVSSKSARQALDGSAYSAW